MKRNQITKDELIYILTACGCLYHNGYVWYEHNDLIECFEQMGFIKESEDDNKKS